VRAAAVLNRPNDDRISERADALTGPEELEPGDVQRTTTFVAWFRREGENFSAVTAGYGVTRLPRPRAELVEGETAKLLAADAAAG
jgi:hypothetical protein